MPDVGEREFTQQTTAATGGGRYTPPARPPKVSRPRRVVDDVAHAYAVPDRPLRIAAYHVALEELAEATRQRY